MILISQRKIKKEPWKGPKHILALLTGMRRSSEYENKKCYFHNKPGFAVIGRDIKKRGSGDKAFRVEYDPSKLWRGIKGCSATGCGRHPCALAMAVGQDTSRGIC